MKNVCLLIIAFLFFMLPPAKAQQHPEMYYSDSSRLGRPLAKDPKIVYFKSKYWMYYSIPENDKEGWGIGIATSNDLTHWTKAGEIAPEESYEAKGICAPGAIVKDGVLHLFYQTYGGAKNDAICHAWSNDGIHFTRDKSNPVFRPSGDWTIGRAIDAEVVKFKNKYFLFFATRDTSFKYQMQGVASAPLKTDFSKSEWTQLNKDSAILFPSLPWEKTCIEAASCTVRGDWLYMFYAGGYNNEPQQIGVAKSKDGLHWQRVFDKPFLPNGKPGSWNESESGHPDIFKDKKGKYWLFFQGNNNKGHTWFISKVPIGWKDGKPFVLK